MADVNITFGIRDFRLFFDRLAVINAVSEKERTILSRTGFYGRKVMRNSIKKARKRRTLKSGKLSKPYRARPPFPRYHVHKNTGLRLILFQYEPTNRGVVIGPLRFRTGRSTHFASFGRFRDYSPFPVPQVLNEGLTTTRLIKYKSGTRIRRTLRYRKFDFADRALEPTAEKMAAITAEIGIV